MIKQFTMKQILFLKMVLLFYEINAQEASVEKSIFGVQTGIFSIFANNELKMSNTTVLRSEIGFRTTNLRIGYSIYDRGTNEPIVPLVFIIEPKWYCDIKQRFAKGLTIENNRAIYLSLMIRYHAGLFMLSGKPQSNIEIIPTIAVRYIFGKCFSFEIGGGIGYQHTFTSVWEEKEYWAFNNVLRIGYVFK